MVDFHRSSATERSVRLDCSGVNVAKSTKLQERHVGTPRGAGIERCVKSLDRGLDIRVGRVGIVKLENVNPYAS